MHKAAKLGLNEVGGHYWELIHNMSEIVDTPTFCAVHPDRETALRCNKCGRYMCTQCAVRTPVGYRCRECARKHEDKFFNASGRDYAIIAGVCAAAGLLAGTIAGFVPLGGLELFAIILGLPAGGAIAELAMRFSGRRRGRYSGEIGAAALVISGLISSVGAIYWNYVSQYNQMVEQYGERLVSQSYPPPSLEYMVTLLGSNLGVLIFVGLAALAVYGRYRLKM
ncbi:MAG: hypothetical protein U0694_28300 [Anaerolineae bacterium]